jgi:endonuclease/exonuclease/phosphatase (EEP) superfamily protein YafD
MTMSAMMRRPSAFLPVAMSGAALFAVFVHVARFGTAPQADEGAAAHIWQLFMIVQLPIVAFFSIKWVPVAPRQALIVLALQIAAIAAALAPVALLNW